MSPAGRIADSRIVSQHWVGLVVKIARQSSCWLCFSMLALAVAAPSVQAQNLSVTASVGNLSPQWAPAPPVDPSSPSASAPLSATANNPPTPPYNCTLNPPGWGWQVGTPQYSPHGSTYSLASSSDYSAWIVQYSYLSPAATLNVIYNVGGYWDFPCTATVSYNDQPACNDTWTASGSGLSAGTSVELISLTMVSGATQTNVTGATNWAAVKTKAGDTVVAQAKTKPDNADGWSKIEWTGGNAGASANQRTVDKGTSAKTTVTAQIGKRSFSVNIWIIWGNVTIQIAGKAAADNNCPELTGNGGNWDPQYGGGNALGVKDHDSLPGLTYAYTIGQMQATCKLTPAGIGSVISTSAWAMKRTKEIVAWDNGGHYTNVNDPTTWAAGPSANYAEGTDDTSHPPQLDLNPTSGGSVDTIYDEDAPGCSTKLSGITIYHTSEYYGNFTQYAAVTLDALQTCSNDAYWSYQAQVDGDKAVGSRIGLNKLDTQLITIPKAPFYAQRN